MKDLTGVNSLQFRYGTNRLTLSSGLDEEINIYIPFTGGDKSVCNVYINGDGSSPVGTGLTVEYAQVVEGNIPNAPYIPTNGTAVTRAADIAKVTSINNLPTTGKPFYVVVDVDFGSLNGNDETIARGDKVLILKVNPNNRLSFYIWNGNDWSILHSNFTTSVKERIIISVNNSTIKMYQLNGSSEKTNVSVSYKFNDIYFGSDYGLASFLNGHIKNLTFVHGVMTDDLAKSYGAHPDA